MNQQTSYNPDDKLHTEVLEEAYKTIDVHVLFDDNDIREVLLVNEEQVAKTYAITLKNNDWLQSEEICMINNAIKNGESIGRAFKSRGFAIQKNVLDVFIVTLPAWLQDAFETNHTTAKSRITEFFINKQAEIYNYAIIAEIYSPDFKKPVVNVQDTLQINIPSVSLLQLGFNKKDIWRLLESKTVAPCLAKIYAPVVMETKEKMQAIMFESLPLLSF